MTSPAAYDLCVISDQNITIRERVPDSYYTSRLTQNQFYSHHVFTAPTVFSKNVFEPVDDCAIPGVGPGTKKTGRYLFVFAVKSHVTTVFFLDNLR